MTKQFFSLLGKISYGALFVLLLPLALLAMAHYIDVPLPSYHQPIIGLFLFVFGLFLVLLGMYALYVYGKGLPMNAYPPTVLVMKHIYGLFPHPIYLGVVIISLALSLFFGSASGLWVVTSLLGLSALALVWGHERPFLLKQHRELAHPWLGLPSVFTPINRVGMMLAVLIPWLILFYGVKFLQPAADAFAWQFSGESLWPVWLWTYPIYTSIYILLPLVFMLASVEAVTKLYYRAWVSMVVMLLFYLTVPIISPVRWIAVDGYLSFFLHLEMQHAAPYNAAFPSYHAVWAFLGASALAEGKNKLWTVLIYSYALAICLSCVTTGMHQLSDILIAGVVAGLLCHSETIWSALLKQTERLANSFAEKRYGKIRVLNHAFYAFLSGFSGFAIISLLLGSQKSPFIFSIMLMSLVGAALWGQWLEGSSALQRPLGYFGALCGGVLMLLLYLYFDSIDASVLAAFACAAPWAQAIGRIRCMVQGCCHGRHSHTAQQGIAVYNPHSRVVSLSRLQGQYLYPTQLYSVVGNIIIGILLLRLWSLQAPISMICGLYFVLAGLLRFVEEAYRGEVQTVTLLGLPIYQWLAILMLLIGSVLLCVSSNPVVVTTLATINWAELLFWSLLSGLMTALMMSVDFPESQRPFSRLSG